MTWTTPELTQDLGDKLRADQYLVVAEVTLRNSTGQRADLLAMRRKLQNVPLLIFEIKTSRPDFLSDIRREKWRGYLADGAVAFAFPSYVADPKEVPPEAAVIVRRENGWRWHRAPRWSEAPSPTTYLLRRLALSVSDQSAARVRAQMTPKAADLWRAARHERQANGRRLAEIARNVETYANMVKTARGEFDELYVLKRRIESEIGDLLAAKNRMAKELAA